MTEYARGGIVEGDGNRKVIIYKGDHIISRSQAEKFRVLLDRLNEGGVDYVEVVEETDDSSDDL